MIKPVTSPRSKQTQIGTQKGDRAQFPVVAVPSQIPKLELKKTFNFLVQPVWET